MEYRRLGTSGLKVSALGLGTNSMGRRVDEQGAKRIIDQALGLGINFIDTANIYGGGLSEEYIGKALKGKRQQAILATKFGRVMDDTPNGRGASCSHIADQVEGSLKRLGTDFIDLYQLHIHDPDTPIEETLRALDNCVRQGKVRYIGCSQVSAWQACEAVWTSIHLNLNAFVSVQSHYNLLQREIEKEMVPFCRAYGLGIIPYFPLEGGVLTGKYRLGEPAPKGSRFAGNQADNKRMSKRNLSIVAGLQKFTEQRGKTVAELAVAWLLADPLVSTVIAGATRPEQVLANERSVGWDLTPEELKEIDAIVQSEGMTAN